MNHEPKLIEIANQIVELRKFSALTETKTSRSQTALIADLDPVSLSIVAMLVNKQLLTWKESQKEETRHELPRQK